MLRKKARYISREKAKQFILNMEPALTREMVDKYTDSEIQEWLTLYKVGKLSPVKCRGCHRRG